MRTADHGPLRDSIANSAPTTLAWRLWCRGWKPGPVVPHPAQPVFVGVTDFHIHHPRHPPGAWRTFERVGGRVVEQLASRRQTRDVMVERIFDRRVRHERSSP
jgi:hypothetical protein